MPALNSSAISHADYNAASRQMRLTFRSGGTYTFCGVPESIYSGLINASSAGQYYHAHIEGRYQC